jgi:hypothetical protein
MEMKRSTARTILLSAMAMSFALSATMPADAATKAAGTKATSAKPATASGAPKTPQQFAAQYMAAFNSKNKAALEKLRYQPSVKSPMQEMVDEMMMADMGSGTQYTKFELLPVDGKRTAPSMGPDGMFYQPNLKPTNMLKLSAVRKDGSSSTTFPIGVKDGVYYQVAIVKAEGAAPAYSFGWQRFAPVDGGWSFMLPNEPEPGKAALEMELGKNALQDPDAYGVVKNTAAIKTTQHFYRSGAEGKRINDDTNKDKYRAARTTYTAETLKEWFSDPKKTLDETVDLRVRSLPGGKLIRSQEIELSGAPGREFEIKADDGTFSLGRVYWIKDALYELTFETTDAKPNTESANKFLTSLEVK